MSNRADNPIFKLQTQKATTAYVTVEKRRIYTSWKARIFDKTMEGHLMPIYDYRCDSCEVSMEIIATIAQSDKKHTCSCGGKLTKILHAPAISFKGDGFYKTDK